MTHTPPVPVLENQQLIAVSAPVLMTQPSSDSMDIASIDKPVQHLSERKPRLHPNQRRRKRFSKNRHRRPQGSRDNASSQALVGEDIYSGKKAGDEG